MKNSKIRREIRSIRRKANRLLSLVKEYNQTFKKKSQWINNKESHADLRKG